MAKHGNPLKKNRKAGADKRAQVGALITPTAQLAKLDARLGKGVGASAERARLARLLES